ncbi:unnamed protein product (macronuclear) [Paramecium tetraurelia]|uniref:Uncharacterized protein n=1 Tax=Paramecium tetraurelia TaxID=5888 RepID=A0D998_PARTE|nr:uncharacterized protein GSPATT00014545001 [Paramecium tetraurelia]CAK79615.1 unnamed protein product [Paramecium tetraurelia]|eukprot:XP_001447012.1 hypothetical protein (macronuclear) [Paramecium tetraurelia strain d4-2]
MSNTRMINHIKNFLYQNKPYYSTDKTEDSFNTNPDSKEKTFLHEFKIQQTTMQTGQRVEIQQ